MGKVVIARGLISVKVYSIKKDPVAGILLI